MFRFTIRDVLWLTVVVALGVTVLVRVDLWRSMVDCRREIISGTVAYRS